MSTVSDEEIRMIQNRLNNRPKKIEVQNTRRVAPTITQAPCSSNLKQQVKYKKEFQW